MTAHPSLPKVINPARLAEQRAQITGIIPLTEMSRLQNLLTDTQGEISLNIDFKIDEGHRVYMHLSAKGNLTFECQRCMENFNYPIDINIFLSPVKNDTEAARMRDYEPILMKGNTLILQDMVEDEILLSLPIIPKHAQNACPVVLSQPEENKADSPFKELLSTFKAKKEE